MSSILLVDDTFENLELVSSYLESEGYEVMLAGNGSEALEILQKRSVSLIISDIMMPKMGGFEFIEKFRKRPSSEYIPIIVLSGADKESTEMIASELGADGYLPKPVSLDLLQKVLVSTLSRRSSIPEPEVYAKKRVNQRAPFLCEAYFEGGGISGLTIISSLSKKGCKLDTSSSIAKGTTLLIKIKLQPGCKIEVLGEVIYTVPGSGIGIEFIALDTESERLIEDLVEKVGSQCVENV